MTKFVLVWSLLMSKYQYDPLVDKGYVKFSLPKDKHKEIFPQHDLHISTKYEYFINDDCVVLRRFHKKIFTHIQILLFIPLIFYYGFENFGELVSDTKKILNQKKYGSFSEFRYWDRPNNTVFTKCKNYLMSL